MNVVGNSVVVSPLLTAPCKIYDSIPEMVEVCDYVSIHVPSLPSTKGMINKELISHMKDGAVILNYARPDLIVEEDVLEAVKSGKISKYMTDLADENLINVPGVIATPHLGASTAEAEDNCAAMAVDELMDYFENGNIRNSVNFPAVTVDPKEGTVKACILYKGIEDISSAVKEAVGADNVCGLTDGKKRTEYGYAIALIGEGTDTSALEKIDGVLKVRVIG